MHSLVTIFQDNYLQTETTGVNKQNKFKIQVVDYLPWIIKMKAVLEADKKCLLQVILMLWTTSVLRVGTLKLFILASLTSKSSSS